MHKSKIRDAIRVRIRDGDTDHKSIRFTLKKYYNLNTTESIVKYWLNKILKEMKE